jgi:hypothetical protein
MVLSKKEIASAKTWGLSEKTLQKFKWNKEKAFNTRILFLAKYPIDAYTDNAFLDKNQTIFEPTLLCTVTYTAYKTLNECINSKPPGNGIMFYKVQLGKDARCTDENSGEYKSVWMKLIERVR